MVTAVVGGLVAGIVRRARDALDTVGGAADALARAVLAVVIREVLDRVDLDAVVSRVDAERIADRIDVNRIAERMDVNLVAERVDIDAVIARIDLVGLTRDVLEEIDLGQIVRDTGGGMTEESVDALRLLGRRGDRGVNRLADRLLGRAAAGTAVEPHDGAGRPPQGSPPREPR